VAQFRFPASAVADGITLLHLWVYLQRSSDPQSGFPQFEARFK